MHSSDSPLLSRRHLLAWTGAAVGMPFLEACSQPVPPMRVGSIVFPGYEPLFLARETGLLDARQVRLVELLANTDTLRALATSQLEAAAMTLDEMITARADGVDLRAVLVFDVSAGADVVLAKAPITLPTLSGKRIAVEDGAMGAIMLGALLRAARLSPQQIHKVAMTLDRSEELFATDQVDVVVTADPWAARLEKKGAQRIFDSKSIPGRIVDVLAVRADIMESHAGSLRHLLRSFFAAQKYMQDASGPASELLSARLQTPPQEVMDLYRGLQLPDLAQNRTMLAVGGTVDRTARDLQAVMLEDGLLPQSAVLQTLSDTRFLPL